MNFDDKKLLRLLLFEMFDDDDDNVIFFFPLEGRCWSLYHCEWIGLAILWFLSFEFLSFDLSKHGNAISHCQKSLAMYEKEEKNCDYICYRHDTNIE